MLVEYTPKNLLSCYYTQHDSFVFKPGINDVDSKIWDQCSKMKKVKRLMESKNLFVVSDVDGDEEKTAIADLNVQKAKLIIEKTYDEELLQTWLASDNRQTVVKAINKQLKFIAEQTTPDKNEE